MASKKAVNKSNAGTVSVSEESFSHIPLNAIIADAAWNARSGNFTEDSGAEDESSEFKDLVASIEQKGQDEPVTVRPKGKKFELIAGFRRFAAISLIADKSKDKTATIKAIVRNLSDVEARSLNLRENTARDDLKGPDLAYGIYDLYVQRTKANGGVVPTDSAIAQELGKNQSYVSKLLRIMKNTDPAVTKAWREAPLGLSVNEMNEIAKLEKDRQQEAYDTAIKGKGGGSGTGRGAALDSAKRKAASLGTLFGKLEKEELISTEGLVFVKHIELMVKLPKEFTAAQKRKVAEAAEEAYQAALEASDAEANAGEDGEE